MIPWLVKTFGPRWILHILPWVIGGIVMIGIYQKLTQATNTTTVGSGGKVINVYHGEGDSQRVPLGGCSAYRINAQAYWQSPTIRQGVKQ